MIKEVASIITFSTWLTLVRVLLAPCVVLAIFSGFFVVASVIFIIAAATDFLDGYYARLYDQETEFGRLLDPIADKILIFSTLFALYTISGQSLLPSWFIILVAAKEIILVVGGIYLFMQKKSIIIAPSWFAKGVTVLLMVFILYLMLIHRKIVPIYYIDQSIQFFAVSSVLILLDYSSKFGMKL